MPRRIHVTERSTYRSCRRYWHYKNHLGLEPKGSGPGPLSFGIAMHHALGTFYKGGDLLLAWSEYVKANPECVTPEMYRLGTVMLTGYLDFADKADAGLSIFQYQGEPAVELELAAEIPGTDAILVGTVDAIVRDRRNNLWVMDHKTYQTFASPMDLETDDQMTSYLWLCRQHGIRVKGVLFNMLRKKEPADPWLVSNGSRLSKDKSIDTTYEKYLAAIHENSFKESDYTDILTALRSNAFYRREEVVRTQRALDSYGEAICYELAEMTDPNLKIYPNFQQSCSRCDMNVLCRIETERGDVESVKSQMYRKVELRY